MSVISIPKILRERLTEDGADALVDIINALENDYHRADEKNKQDVIVLSEEKFEKRLAQVKSEIVQWMFVFWVGQIGVLTAVLFAFFRK